MADNACSNSSSIGSQITWKAVSFTYVEYPSGDLIGKLLACASLLPIFIGVGFISLILFKRDLHTISFFAGLVLNEFLSLILKYAIRQPRPCRSGDTLATEFGMPSSHSQFMAFFAVYFILLLNLRVYSITNTDRLWKLGISVQVAIIAIIVSYSRIYLRYHTTMQVFIGFILGALLGLAWFLFNHLYFTYKFSIIASWKVSEFFWIRDSTLIPNVMRFEYASIRGESRLRRKKVKS